MHGHWAVMLLLLPALTAATLLLLLISPKPGVASSQRQTRNDN